MSLLDRIADHLGSNPMISSLMGGLRTTEADTRALVSTGVPAVLAGLGLQSGGDGAEALHGLVGSDGGALAESAGALFEHGDHTGLASGLVGSLFGSRRGAVEAQLSRDADVDVSSVSRFLPLLTPVVMSLTGRFAADDGLDAEGLSEQLATFGADGPLGDVLAGTDDDDRAGFVAGLGALAAGGGLAALVPEASASSSAAGATAAAPTDATVDYDHGQRAGLVWLLPTMLLVGGLMLGLILWQCGSSGVRLPRVDTTAAAADASAGDSEGGDTAAADTEDSDAADDGQTDDNAAAEDGDAAGAADDTTDSDGDTDEGAGTDEDPDGDGDGNGDGDTGADAGADGADDTTDGDDAADPPADSEPTLAELAAGNPDLSALLAVAADLGLADTLADPEAGPFTIFAPTNGGFDAATDVVDRLTDDQLARTVEFHIVPGLVTRDQLTPGATFTTLSGEVLTIGADGLVPGGAELLASDLAAANGLVHVIDGVLVPNSVQRDLATDDVNAILSLDPIQFASGSSEILPESVPTLDQAVAVLLTVPEGTRLQVEGHTDTDGDAGFNETLSQARADAVVAYLTDNGVDPSILTAVGFGEDRLKIDPELTPEDKAQNRRIEFVDVTAS